MENGSIYTFKLVHVHGSVRCQGNTPASYWGCTHYTYGDKQLGTIITFKNKTALQLAEYRGEGKGCGYYSYKLDKVAVNSSVLEFNNLPSPLTVSTGQEFQVWFSGDLYNCGESTNSGQTCIDVYAWYAWIKSFQHLIETSVALEKISQTSPVKHNFKSFSRAFSITF